MRTREATYADYGFKEGEGRQLKQYCLDLELPDKLLLLQCAHECNPMIEDDLFYSISKGVAFQILARKGIDQNYKCHASRLIRAKNTGIIQVCITSVWEISILAIEWKIRWKYYSTARIWGYYNTREWITKREESVKNQHYVGKRLHFRIYSRKSNNIFTHGC